MLQIRKWFVPAIILGASAGILAFGGPDEGPGGPGGPGGGPGGGGGRPGHHRGGPDDSLHQRKPPKPLTDEQKAYAKAERSLRDSMEQAIRSYADSVRKGSDPRSMTTDRARINDYARRLERLRQDNLDVWLDLLALRPMGNEWAKHGRGQDDTLPPPPAGDSARTNP